MCALGKVLPKKIPDMKPAMLKSPMIVYRAATFPGKPDWAIEASSTKLVPMMLPAIAPKLVHQSVGLESRVLAKDDRAIVTAQANADPTPGRFLVMI